MHICVCPCTSYIRDYTHTCSHACLCRKHEHAYTHTFRHARVCATLITYSHTCAHMKSCTRPHVYACMLHYISTFFFRLAHTYVNTHIRAHVFFAYVYTCVCTHPMHVNVSAYVCPDRMPSTHSCAYIFAVSRMCIYTCVHTL